MSHSFSQSSIDAAIRLAPALKDAATQIGNPVRREHIAAVAACGETLCRRSTGESFGGYAREAIDVDLVQEPGGLAALQQIATPSLVAIEGDRDTRIKEMALGMIAALVEYQTTENVPNTELIEIAAVIFALYALADEMQDDEDVALAFDSMELLDEGIEIGADLAA